MKRGEWVVERRSGRVGIISATDHGRVYVKWYKYKNGTPIDLAVGWYYFNQIDKAPLELTVDDAKALIDIALDSKDIEWARELYEWYILE